MDERLARYRAVPEAGADPALVGRWITEVQDERLRAKLVLDELGPAPPAITDAEAHVMLADLRQLAERLKAADSAQKASLYARLSLRMTYYPEDRIVRVSANPPIACATRARSVSEGGHAR